MLKDIPMRLEWYIFTQFCHKYWLLNYWLYARGMVYILTLQLSMEYLILWLDADSGAGRQEKKSRWTKFWWVGGFSPHSEEQGTGKIISRIILVWWYTFKNEINIENFIAKWYMIYLYRGSETNWWIGQRSSSADFSPKGVEHRSPRE